MTGGEGGGNDEGEGGGSDEDVGQEGQRAVRGIWRVGVEIPLFGPGAGSAASAGMTEMCGGGDGECGAGGRVVSACSGAGGAFGGRDVAWMLVASRYPCSGQGQAPRQARV